ncbi:MAG: HD domain-containing protein [Lachnospiraceae bacterium]|nr:HD domain-containing protein [Lachnospiraceae bacterium]
MNNKRFKDPIYGYIEINGKLINQVIDTASFQRLRDIIQTSYSPLYTSSLHNRFTHSIGVYHLGKIAAQAFTHSCISENISPYTKIKKYIEVFELACLLHDVGHAPFSHTGEDFYFDGTKHAAFHKQIIELTGDSLLKEEIIKNSYKAAAHELMSVIVGLKTFGGLIKKDKRSFFARCITGYKYTEELTDEKQLLNCLIELLNSTMIDVDKLDYLIRDAYMTGFDTTKLDYVRLLESIRITKYQEEYKVCYYKTALSVIENVVYARDSERKWIQNHPTVLYEIYLLQNIMTQITTTYMKQSNIGYDYLTEKGKLIKDLGIVRLLSDSDILYLMKNLPNEEFVKEYFNRKLRKHPLWKTEAEYQAVFTGREGKAEIIEREFVDLKKELSGLGYSNVIKDKALDACRQDAVHIEAEISKLKKETPDSGRDNIKEKLQRLEMSLTKRKYQIKIMEVLEDFARREDIDFEFIIISEKQFNSGFGKPEFSKISMIFPELNVPCEFGTVSNSLKASESVGENFFYLYCNRKEPEKELHISKLIKDLVKIAYDIERDREEQLVDAQVK